MYCEDPAGEIASKAPPVFLRDTGGNPKSADCGTETLAAHAQAWGSSCITPQRIDCQLIEHHWIDRKTQLRARSLELGASQAGVV
jgi:hypothetical protein